MATRPFLDRIPNQAVRAYWNRRPCNGRRSPEPVGTRAYVDQLAVQILADRVARALAADRLGPNVRYMPPAKGRPLSVAHSVSASAG